MKGKLLSGVFLMALAVSAHGQQAGTNKDKFFVYDGSDYKPEQLLAATRSPVEVIKPSSGQNGLYVAPRAYDGHFYLPGFINGFPVTFMVDTGASMTAIPAELAKNAGIRAGIARDVVTASGKTTGGLTENNKVVVGRYVIEGAKILVATKLKTPLLGNDVLSRFKVRQTAESIELRPIGSARATEKETSNESSDYANFGGLNHNLD